MAIKTMVIFAKDVLRSSSSGPWPYLRSLQDMSDEAETCFGDWWMDWSKGKFTGKHCVYPRFGGLPGFLSLQLLGAGGGRRCSKAMNLLSELMDHKNSFPGSRNQYRNPSASSAPVTLEEPSNLFCFIWHHKNMLPAGVIPKWWVFPLLVPPTKGHTSWDLLGAEMRWGHHSKKPSYLRIGREHAQETHVSCLTGNGSCRQLNPVNDHKKIEWSRAPTEKFWVWVKCFSSSGFFGMWLRILIKFCWPNDLIIVNGELSLKWVCLERGYSIFWWFISMFAWKSCNFEDSPIFRQTHLSYHIGQHTCAYPMIYSWWLVL